MSTGYFGQGSLQGLDSEQYTGLTGWLIRIGVAGDERTATGILVAIAVCAVLLAFLVPHLFRHSGPPQVSNSVIDDDPQYQADQAAWERAKESGVIR